MIGQDTCDMIKEQIESVSKYADALIEVFDDYCDGKIIIASNKAFNLFEDMKTYLMQRYYGAYNKTFYYRIRKLKESESLSLERKELFHIPILKNYLVGAERYSMPGHPCLYLASQLPLAWYECNLPDKFVVAAFEFSTDENSAIKLVDFSEKLVPLKHSFVSWFYNEQDKMLVSKYLLKHLCTYPLRAACSVVKEHPEGSFFEEYIVPQLLVQWIANNSDFDGISYESCSNNECVKSLCGYNVVLITKKFDSEGYDVVLRNNVKLGKPKVLSMTESNGVTDSSDKETSNTIKLFMLESSLSKDFASF